MSNNKLILSKMLGGGENSKPTNKNKNLFISNLKNKK